MRFLGKLVLCFIFLLQHAYSKEGEVSAPRKKTALVTGASSGIGKALVKELLDRGYYVVGVSSDSEKLQTLSQNLCHPMLCLIPCDVTDRSLVLKISEALQEDGVIPELFFLNAGLAGIAAVEPITHLETCCHKKIFDVNYFGVLNFVEAWLKPCKEQQGATFVVTSSINAIFAPPGGSGYAASKAAISKAFDGLQLSYSKDSLNFLSVFSGPVDTPGLSGKLPFTWSSEKMAKYMVDKALSPKAHSYPSWTYSILAYVLNALPSRQVRWILEHFF